MGKVEDHSTTVDVNGKKLNLVHLPKDSCDKTIFFIHGLGGRIEQFRL
jgi:hypothetical protein